MHLKQTSMWHNIGYVPTYYEGNFELLNVSVNICFKLKLFVQCFTKKFKQVTQVPNDTSL